MNGLLLLANNVYYYSLNMCSEFGNSEIQFRFMSFQREQVNYGESHHHPEQDLLNKLDQPS